MLSWTLTLAIWTCFFLFSSSLLAVDEEALVAATGVEKRLLLLPPSFSVVSCGGEMSQLCCQNRSLDLPTHLTLFLRDEGAPEVRDDLDHLGRAFTRVGTDLAKDGHQRLDQDSRYLARGQ